MIEYERGAIRRESCAGEELSVVLIEYRLVILYHLLLLLIYVCNSLKNCQFFNRGGNIFHILISFGDIFWPSSFIPFVLLKM